jgi:hypothetical protein
LYALFASGQTTESLSNSQRCGSIQNWIES